jgi:hypothetical protein
MFLMGVRCGRLSPCPKDRCLPVQAEAGLAPGVPSMPRSYPPRARRQAFQASSPLKLVVRDQRSRRAADCPTPPRRVLLRVNPGISQWFWERKWRALLVDWRALLMTHAWSAVYIQPMVMADIRAYEACVNLGNGSVRNRPARPRSPRCRAWNPVLWLCHADLHAVRNRRSSVIFTA